MNVEKTKGIKLLYDKKSYVSKVYPCNAYGIRVGRNSIRYTKFQYIMCSTSLLKYDWVAQFTFMSLRIKSVWRREGKFCYFGNMFSLYGGASETVLKYVVPEGSSRS